MDNLNITELDSVIKCLSVDLIYALNDNKEYVPVKADTLRNALNYLEFISNKENMNLNE